MSVRRVCRQLGNTRVGLRTVLLLIVGLLILHTCALLLVRNIFSLKVADHPYETSDKRRDIPATSEKSGHMTTPEKEQPRIGDLPRVTSSKKAVPLVGGQAPSTAQVEPEVKHVDLHNVVRNLGALHRTTPAAKSITQKRHAEANADASQSSSWTENRDEPQEEADTAKKDDDDTSPSRKSCIRYVSIYSPRMEPFHYWREYVNLEQAFKEAKTKNSSFYDNRITQRREFPTMFIECPGYRCDVALRPTTDERFLARSDALLINVVPQEVRYKMAHISERLMKVLPRRVKVFFYAMECPLMMSHWDHTIQDIQYHYTMTYHADSDVFFPYGQYVPGEPTDTGDREINFAENKTGLLVWTASNCHNTFWPRLEWVRRLEKLMPFDIYGKCGHMTCLPPLSPNCTKSQSVYKFYLALENAPCDGYISEKFWVNSLLNGVVPLVYGGKREAYERVAPPNSFIHVSDFASQQELVDYLQMIDKNDNLYNEFFAWRKQGRAEKIYPDLYPKAFCKVLPKLSKYSTPPVKRIGDSKYFQACRGGHHRNFTQDGDIDDWEPWR